MTEKFSSLFPDAKLVIVHVKLIALRSLQTTLQHFYLFSKHNYIDICCQNTKVILKGDSFDFHHNVQSVLQRIKQIVMTKVESRTSENCNMFITKKKNLPETFRKFRNVLFVIF